MANSKTERSENVNAIELNCKVAKKLQPPPPFLHQRPPPFSGLSLLSSKKIHTPQVTQFLEGPTPPLIRGRGVPTMNS